MQFYYVPNLTLRCTKMKRGVYPIQVLIQALSQLPCWPLEQHSRERVYSGDPCRDKYRNSPTDARLNIRKFYQPGIGELHRFVDENHQDKYVQKWRRLFFCVFHNITNTIVGASSNDAYLFSILMTVCKLSVLIHHIITPFSIPQLLRSLRMNMFKIICTFC